MCGIAGLVHRDPSRPVHAPHLEAMAKALVHRGPDDQGTLIEGSVGFAMRRLSVIDLASGRQPIWNEARDVGVVQNGEIYNFLDLRADLTRRGHRFATSSDTEAIVHLYEETGPTPDLPSRLHGMFAFALFDRTRQVVVLARDRAGKKPLYLYRDGDLLAFASEIPALFAAGRSPGRGAKPAGRSSGHEPDAAARSSGHGRDAAGLRFDQGIDEAALDAYLALQYVPGPGTIFRRVRHLPPGSMLVLQRGPSGWEERPERRYWRLPDRPAGEGARWGTFSEAVDGCEAILSDAVRRRLVSDVPLGAFLSGGLDSSLVAALMARHGNGRVATFSIGFDDPRLDESEAAAAVARHLGTDHHVLKMPPPSATDLMRILRHCDQPLGDPAIVPTWHLSRMARERVTVALSGEGADEVFAGYHWYRRPLLERLARRRDPAGDAEALFRRREQAAAGARRALLAAPLREAAGTDSGRASHRADGGRASYLAAADGHAGLPPIAALQAIDFEAWMPDDLLVKVDRMSMAHSLEVRCPYLDHRLVEAVLPAPDRLKIRGGRRKALLRAVARRHLPEEVARRKKHGFQVPVDRLLRTALKEPVADLLARDRLARQGAFDPDGVADLLRRWRDDPSLARLVWKVLCFQAWRDGSGLMR